MSAGNDDSAHVMRQIEQLKYEAEQTGYEGDLDSALMLLDQAAALADQCIDPSGMGLVWRGRANVLGAHGFGAESLEAFQVAAAIYAEYSTPFEVAKTRTGEIYALGHLERFDDAVALAEWLRPQFVDFPQGLAFVESNLAQVLMWAMRDEEALAGFERAYQLFAQLDAPLWMARTLHHMGITAQNLDRLEQARTYYQQAYAGLKAADDTYSVVRVERNLAFLNLREGNLQEALDYLMQARASAESLPPDGQDAAALDLLEARIRRALNQNATAERLLQQSLAIYRPRGFRIESAQILVELAHVWLDDPNVTNLSRALDALEQAETMLETLNVPLLLGLVQLEQGEISHKLGRDDRAIERARVAMRPFVDHGLALREAQAVTLLADCTWKLEPDTAEAHYRHAVDLAGDAAPLISVRCKHGLGRLAAARGAIDSAESHFAHALDLLDTMRRNLNTHHHQAGFLDDKQQIGEELLAALHTQADNATRVARVLHWVEHFKARALADLLVEQPLTDDDLDQHLHDLLTEREAIATAYDQRVAVATASSSAQLTATGQRAAVVAGSDARTQEELAQLRRQLHQLDNRLAAANNMAYAWRSGRQNDLSSVHDLLDSNTMLLSYYIADGQLHVLTASDTLDDLVLTPLEVSLPTVEATWRQSRRWVIRPKRNRRDVQKRLAQLYDWLLAPLETRIGEKSRLIILPHSSLFHIPFAGLYDGFHEQYAVERWTIQIAPSATIWQYCRRLLPSSPKTERPLLLGYPGEPEQSDYLPAVNAEIDSLLTLLPDADALRNADATQDALLQQMAQRPLIHLAGHIYYDAAHSLGSGMPLAGGRWLRASDLYLRFGRLQGATVVLSGCDSARVQSLGGDVLGLTSAFLYAGAAGLVAGLWKVDDAATAQLMTAFYRAWLDGRDSAEALRQAQLDLLRSDDFALPYFWAAFTLNGDARHLL
ncbi:MAG: CHAT domain-containing protein [Anaerolineae bacterium]|nr:CHAT domain-containing protein [Anaerolineae bacterium]